MGQQLPLSRDFIEDANARRMAALQDDYDSLGRQLRRRGLDIEAIERKVAAFSVALPTWGAGRGGTRFAKFPFAGAPTNIHEKLEDCAVVQQLCRITPRVSPHFPWDNATDYRELRQRAIEHNIECIRIGRILGSQAITVWIGDGSNFPGQLDLTRAFDRYLESTSRIYGA